MNLFYWQLVVWPLKSNLSQLIWFCGLSLIQFSFDWAVQANLFFILNQTMGFILSYCYYYFHKRLISVNNLRSTGINIEEWGGDNFFFQWLRGRFAVLIYIKAWVKSKEKEMLNEKNIKGELKFRILKFTPVFSLCYRYELYPLKWVLVLEVTPACARINQMSIGHKIRHWKENSVWFEPEMRLKMTFNIWQETFCGNFCSNFLHEVA